MIFLATLSFFILALVAGARLGRLPQATSAILRRVLRPIGLVLGVSLVFGLLIGFAGAKRAASAPAWSQVREARQRLDPKSKTNDPERWKRELKEGEARVEASASAPVDTTAIVGPLLNVVSIALGLSGLLGALALLRFRAGG